KYVNLQQTTKIKNLTKQPIIFMALLQPMQRVILRTGTEWEVMLNMDDHTFKQHFRVTKPQFEYLAMKLQHNGFENQNIQGVCPVPVKKKVLMLLWYMANQHSFREMSDKFDVSLSSAHRIILQALSIMSTIGTSFISWPDSSGRAESAAAFQRLCGLAGIIGAIDGCHIRVQRPPIRGGDYMNCKSFYSVLLQGIVDERRRFIDIFAGPPGKVRDARMLKCSDFYAKWQENMGEHSLLGDSAYVGPDFPFVVTPKCDDEALTKTDELQNSRMRCGRAVVDQAFGRMKCRWRRLRDLQNTRIDAVVMIIMAACFLHNMCTDGVSDISQGALESIFLPRNSEIPTS
uniref:DDE Tnp4 domain-containing protein n=1 Tax=Gouania willdenowi TaxID=441366 RepID=A0A8C5G485_GOUWI